MAEPSAEYRKACGSQYPPAWAYHAEGSRKLSSGVFYFAILLLGVVSGATASIVGFGIGSLLTPVLALQFGTSTAVAAVTIPHALATIVRCWRLRPHIDRSVLVRFGLLSALGALAGALVYTSLGLTVLTRILGGLLVLTSVTHLTGCSSRWQPRGHLIGAFGVLSGFFGGLAGNQGGLRSAAMLAFRLTPIRFVATATAIGVLVDITRTPVYLWHAGDELLILWYPITLAAIGVLIGTVVGERILFGLSVRRFSYVVGIAIGALGGWLLLGN
jgi:uncharacterized protein